MSINFDFLNYDICILVVVIAFAIIGAAKGFTKTALSFAFSIAALIAAKILREPVTEVLIEKGIFSKFEIASEAICNAVSFVLIYIVLRVLVTVILYFVSTVCKLPVIKQCDKLLGFAFGLLKGIVIGAVITAAGLIYQYLFPDSEISKFMENSVVAEFFTNMITSFLEVK